MSLSDKKNKRGQKRRRKNSMFSERKENPAAAVAATCIAVLAAIVLIALIIFSFLADGRAGLAAGGIGTIMLFVQVVALIAAISTFGRKEISLKYPLIGVIGNGVLILIYGIIYVSGTGFF